MNIWFIVGEGISNKGTTQLFQSSDAIPKGVRLVFLGDLRFTLDSGLPPQLFIKEEKVAPPDVYMMLGDYDLNMKMLGDQLDLLGCFAYNNMKAKSIAMSKIATYQVLAKAGLPIIKTVPIFPSVTKEVLIHSLGLPMVVKPDNGFGGEGVILVRTELELENVLKNARDSKNVFLAQEYIETSKGFDIRVVTVNHKAQYAVKRQTGDPNEFRSNMKQGGSFTSVELTDEILELSEKTSKASGLDFAGLDLLMGKEGYVVGEVNSSPGLKSNANKEELFKTLIKDIGEKYLAAKLN